MAECYPEKDGYAVTIDGKYSSSLDIECFFLMMKDPSYCYKFYWLEAMVKLISEGITETTFNEIIDEMIVSAWYSVREFHVHLSGIQNGEVRDGLERAVVKLAELSSLPSCASRTEIRNAIVQYESELKPFKEQLTNMVPYRALAGFFRRSNEPVSWGSTVRLTEYIRHINQTILLPYTLGTGRKLKKEVYFSQAWAEMIQDHTVSILGWIQYEKIKWLQMNNPELPGLIYKLAPPDEKMRKLGNVRKLWEGVMETYPVSDVFTGKRLERKQYDVDHFIPWSFVMNDELWNLMPMDSSLNASKGSRLPKWNPFFERFAGNQFQMYELIQKAPEIRKLYEACYRDNLHSLWAGQELYRPGNSKQEFFSVLEKNMRPVYDSARRQGYELWNYNPV